MFNFVMHGGSKHLSLLPAESSLCQEVKFPGARKMIFLECSIMK